MHADDLLPLGLDEYTRRFAERLAPAFRLELAVLVARVIALPRTGGRQLVAVAGAPASGKSEMAALIAAAVTGNGRPARVIPMDGFHLDNTLLDERGLRARKGAPETFDAQGFIALVQRLRDGGEAIYPRFDRERDIAIAGAGCIEPACDVAIVEGNYLLLDEAPWRALAPLWTISVRLEVPESVIRERCVQRWLDHAHTPDAALARAERNDLPNARRIMSAQLPADFVLTYSG